MEFWSTIVRLLRRPRVIVPALLAGLALGGLAYQSTGATYVSSTTMVLTMTEYGGTETEDPTEPTQLINPLLNFNGSLTTTSAILIQTMATGDVREQLGASDGGTQLIVNDGRTNPELLGLSGLSGPFLYLEGRSSSAAEASRIVLDAQELVRQKLNDWQRSLNAPQKTYVTLVDVVAPTSPQADSGRALKLGVLGFLFAVLVCVGIAYAGHQLRARRQARAGAGAPPSGTPATTRATTPAKTPARTPARTTAKTPAKTPPKTAAKASHPKPRAVDEPDRVLVAATSVKRARPTASAPRKKVETAVVPVPRKQNGRSRSR